MNVLLFFVFELFCQANQDGLYLGPRILRYTPSGEITRVHMSACVLSRLLTVKPYFFTSEGEVSLHLLVKCQCKGDHCR